MPINLEIFLKNNQDIFWDVSDLSKLDNNAIEERFIKYGDWDNILDLIKIFGLEKFKEIYLELKNKKRVNLSDKTINFFDIYLNV